MNQALGPTGLSALWNKIKASFGVKLEIEGSTLSLKNAAATPVILSQITLPDTGVSMAEVNEAIDQKTVDYQTKEAMSKYPTNDQMSNAIAAAHVGAATYKGAVSSEVDISSSDYKAGWYWVVKTAGVYCSETCESGDMIFANTDKGSAFSSNHFDIVQNNIVEMTAAEVESICTL